MYRIDKYAEKQAPNCIDCGYMDPDLYNTYGVKRGLRDINGQGVLTGLTNISKITSFKELDGKLVPCDGELLYRGYDVRDLIAGASNRKMIYEEGAYLLLFGELPNEKQLKEFHDVIARCMTLPSNFTRDVIMKAPEPDIMCNMTKSILTLASYDDHKNDLDISNVLRQSIRLIGNFPMLAAYSFHAYNYYRNCESMFVHRPDPDLSLTENFLRLLRPDMSFTEIEARTLDVAFLLHMEHGGGNNSTFTTRVVTSAGTDTYSAIAAAMCSLKGSRHGGANLMVMEMMDNIRENVRDTDDEEEVENYLTKIVRREVFDRKGLIYGMGHAVYSLSDPREKVFRGYVEKLAGEKGREKDLRLYESIEKLAPEIIARERKIYKGVSPNVDFYSGFVYEMMGIPRELYTPIFSVARIAGWSAHRIEELVANNKIIRPAYKSVLEKRSYKGLEDRI
ncbi:MAG: citrate/2-methylcitrate synthase [Lachnospiraceae bacterium]|nr:citrate/2-methylcitrate synthase [Lachnospiraceae bacterium]